MQVFWARGFEGATLTELTSAMGIGKKSLYDTFGNKRSLFLQSLELYSEIYTAQLRARLLDGGSPLANLEKVLIDWKNMHSCPGSKGCLLGTNIADFDTADEEVSGILRGKLEEMEEVFFETLKSAQTKGEISESLDPRNTARMLICLTQGFALVGRVLRSVELLESSVKSTMEYLTRQ